MWASVSAAAPVTPLVLRSRRDKVTDASASTIAVGWAAQPCAVGPLRGGTLPVPFCSHRLFALEASSPHCHPGTLLHPPPSPALPLSPLPHRAASTMPPTQALNQWPLALLLLLAAALGSSPPPVAAERDARCVDTLRTAPAAFDACRTGEVCWLCITEPPFIWVDSVDAATDARRRRPFNCSDHGAYGLRGSSFQLLNTVAPGDLCVFAGDSTECKFNELVDYLDQSATEPSHPGYGVALGIHGALLTMPHRVGAGSWLPPIFHVRGGMPRQHVCALDVERGTGKGGEGACKEGGIQLHVGTEDAVAGHNGSPDHAPRLASSRPPSSQTGKDGDCAEQERQRRAPGVSNLRDVVSVYF